MSQSSSRVPNPSCKWVFLSHPLDPATPTYGNGRKFQVSPVKSMEMGDSCNSIQYSSDNHVGSHFDFPKHFDRHGKDVLSFSAEDFVHDRVAVAWLDMNRGDLLTPDLIEESLHSADREASLLLIRTGAATYRDHEDFWAKGPGLGVGLAGYLRSHFANLRCVGVDSISITSYCWREVGRTVHKEFLCDAHRPLTLLEDLNLEPLRGKIPHQAILAPLRIQGADGAPATVFACV